MTDHLSHCSCGWPRPLIGLCDLAGGMPPKTTVPVYDCPLCGATHVSCELNDLLTEQVIETFNAAKAQRGN
jgi:hypothetical protein